ncbi:zeta toxin family protein [Pseudomonas lopnurensis]|uniref:zeta toxin family protein n=1 Tax=Pseudomonas lopnurensis TaxID=1477517 RepID=UPI001F1B3CDB|nr:zeta toxin family protein [Pseudomonas lopnurensis]
MYGQDERIKRAAMEYAKSNRARIAREMVDLAVYPPEEVPTCVFMAGSPGAGKTEVSKRFVQSLEQLAEEGFDDLGHVLRIDPDDFREGMPGYTGGNSSLFNDAVVKILEKVLDRAYEKDVSFLLDGTLSSQQVAEKNIRRALGRNRYVLIMYVYQDPLTAWNFVESRRRVNGRSIPLSEFV